MHGFEYKVVPAPRKGVKAKGVKGAQARFAHALQLVMNDLGAEGWEYQRTDTLPMEERQGLTGKTTSFQTMLVFSRQLEAEAPEDEAVPALIEDQSDTVQAAQAEQEAADTDAPDRTPTDAPNTMQESQQPAEDRVAETLMAPPMSALRKRNGQVDGRSEDGPNIPAE